MYLGTTSKHHYTPSIGGLFITNNSVRNLKDEIEYEKQIALKRITNLRTISEGDLIILNDNLVTVARMIEDRFYLNADVIDTIEIDYDEDPNSTEDGELV